MYQILDEMDMWSLIKKINHVLHNWNSEYIVSYLIHLN
jgi:hypothetical protein